MQSIQVSSSLHCCSCCWYFVVFLSGLLNFVSFANKKIFFLFANIFLSCTYWEVFIASRENMHWTMSGSSRFNRWISILNFIDWNFQMQSDAFWKAKNNNFIRKKFQRNLFQHPRAITKKQEKKCHPKLWLNFFLSLFYIYKCNRLSSTNLSVFKNNKYKKNCLQNIVNDSIKTRDIIIYVEENI